MTIPKILLVDDEPYNIDYLEQELEEIDVETMVAYNGQDALEMIETGAPDLVLLDIMMPVMDGFAVLSRVKANPATRDIPVIIISASNDLQTVVKGIQLGAEDYLPKPFEPTLLHARISASLEKKRLRDMQVVYQKSLERELDIGRQIQQSFLPAELPQVPGWEIAVCFQAAREVAGDFYDTFLLPDGDLVVVIGDVCGKGVGAALFMTLFRSLIRVTSTAEYFYPGRAGQLLTPDARLQHVLQFTNAYLTETHADADMFATIFIGILNQQSGSLTYANCGNEPALLVEKDRAVTLLPATGPVVGVIPDARFEIGERTLAVDDLLLVYTDGVPDALNAESAAFGSQRLREFATLGGSAPAVVLKLIQDQLCHFIGAENQFDDITMLAVRRMPE